MTSFIDRHYRTVMLSLMVVEIGLLVVFVWQGFR